MINKHKLYSIALFSIAIALMLVSIAGASQFAYITKTNMFNWGKTVSVIDTSTNKVTATVPVGDDPHGVAVIPDGANVYVVNGGEKPAGWNNMGEGYYAPSTVSVINTTQTRLQLM
jgi:YVTN family beta-propeller protein